MNGVGNYAYAHLMFAVPPILGFENEKQVSTVCHVVGSAVLGATMLTRAECGVARIIPFSAHSALDVISLFSLAAPWILRFAGDTRARNTFVVMGAIGGVVTALTKHEEMSSDFHPVSFSWQRSRMALRNSFTSTLLLQVFAFVARTKTVCGRIYE